MTEKLAFDRIGKKDYRAIKIALGGEGEFDGYFGEDKSGTDAFGRQRVSTPSTIFDSKLLYDKRGVFWDEVITGIATSAHSTEHARVLMSVGEDGDSVIRQTKMRFNYQPGKSFLILMTGVLGEQTSNTTKRIGAFDQNNGVFFEQEGDTLSVCIRKATADIKVAQKNWNVDKLDGSGLSGITLDTSKSQIFIIDFEWLGVGTVRYGFVIDGKIIYCHFRHNANVHDTVYMSTPNLPLRYQVSSSGGSCYMSHICSSVISEGGQDPNGLIFNHSNGNTAISAPTSGTKYVALALRLKETAIDATIIPIGLDFLSTSNTNFRWFVSINPTLSSALTYSDYHSSSSVQQAVGTGQTLTEDGIIIEGGYAAARQMVASPINAALRIGSKIDGTRDEMVVCVQPLANSADIYGSIEWRELV